MDWLYIQFQFFSRGIAKKAHEEDGLNIYDVHSGISKAFNIIGFCFLIVCPFIGLNIIFVLYEPALDPVFGSLARQPISASNYTKKINNRRGTANTKPLILN